MNTLALRRLLRKTRGTAPLQAVLLLAVALFILLGLRYVIMGRSAPAMGIDSASSAAGAPSASAASPPAASPESVAARPALSPEAAAAQERLDKIAYLEMRQDVADLAYHEVGSKEFNDLMAKYSGAWNISFFEVPATGAKVALLTAKDPNDKRVFVGLGGTEGADWRHWAVNFGQHLPAMSEEEAIGEVLHGVLTRSPTEIILSPIKYLLSTLGRGDYEGVRQLGATLTQKYGAENVYGSAHSKGGGELTFSAAMNGFDAVTFNGSGMSAASLDLIRKSGKENPEKYITNIVAEGEALGRVDLLGTKLGDVITVEGKEKGWGSSLANHKLRNILIDKPVRFQPAKPLPR